MSNVRSLPVIERAASHDNRTAIIDSLGTYTYGELLASSQCVASALLHNQSDLNEARVVFMVPSGFQYVATLWGIWQAGGIAIPLCTTHPLPEIEYVIEDTAAKIIVAHPEFDKMLRPVANAKNAVFLSTTEAIDYQKSSLPNVDVGRRALILYTSGTTSKPKGVVATHENVTAQITTLTDAWEWTENDHILHVLPLHHTHGIINVLSCALWSGAICEMLPKFDSEKVWERFIRADLTLFMAVPTIYVKLISTWQNASPKDQEAMSAACAKMRLMVSGSAALPVSVFEEFKLISKHELLERYGMTEIGMALSNPVRGERRPGFVGLPLPRVEARLVDEDGNQIDGEGKQGEIQIKGPNVFLEYWGKPEATQEAFRDGWFCTGDIAVVESGYYCILGRASVDIIKTGGYKVSALEIEEVLRMHDAIVECAVIGVEDAEWGERVGAAVVTNGELSLSDLRDWAKEKLASYKLPTKLIVMSELPVNLMGKVNKADVKRLFE